MVFGNRIDLSWREEVDSILRLLMHVRPELLSEGRVQCHTAPIHAKALYGLRCLIFMSDFLRLYVILNVPIYIALARIFATFASFNIKNGGSRRSHIELS